MTQITQSSPRNTIQVTFPDGRTFDGPKGVSAETFIEQAKPATNGPVMAALVDGKLRELSYALERDTTLTPVDASDSDGSRIYRRSLSFLLIAAINELHPEAVINIQHSIPFGGYYCQREDGVVFTEPQLNQIKARMAQLVADEIPIKSESVPLEEALQIFRDLGDHEKAELFTRRRNPRLTLYELNGVRDYFHGFMVSNTRYIDQFDLHLYGDGFILHFPRRRDPKLQPFEDDKWLVDVFQKYSDWLALIGVPSVAALNRANDSGRIKEVILIAEALHNRQIAGIADKIEAKDGVKIILISGPTSAGKTTFSKRLAVQLLARGMRPVAVGLDDYFVDRELTPRDETGDYDFEHLEAVDVPLFSKHLRQLLAGETITQPHYNFYTGGREWGGNLTLKSDQVLIIEGIHGLNPRLIDGVPQHAVFRIFINAFTQVNLDKHNRVATTDTRKLRRMVRDYNHRGYDAAATIRRWPKVRKGEKKWIFPYQVNADALFNSALVYEMAALKAQAEPILLQVEPDTPERVEANRLRAFLQWFEPLSAEAMTNIPSDSLLREFVGGSILEDFKPWQE